MNEFVHEAPSVNDSLLYQLNPVGKIVICEKPESDDCDPEDETGGASDDCSSDDECPSADDCPKPIASKKFQKRVNDQRFTIETTVKVEPCPSKKKSSKMDSRCSSQAETCPSKKKKKSMKVESDCD